MIDAILNSFNFLTYRLSPLASRLTRRRRIPEISYGRWAVAIAFLLGSAPVGAVNGTDVVAVLANGTINWTTGKVTATGLYTAVDSSPNRNLDNEDKLAAALADARKKLLAVLKNVRIDANTVVGNFSEERGAIIAELKHLVEVTREKKPAFLSDGTVKVTLAIDLYGAFAQLVLPVEIKQVETIRAIKRSKKAESDDPISAINRSPSESGAFSGLIVDARHITVQPVLMPIIRDERGEEVYSAAYVSREYAVQNGVAQYSRNPNAAAVKERVGDNPLIIRALDTVGEEHSQLVVSDADAARVRAASENLSLLKQCRVSVMVDSLTQ